MFDVEAYSLAHLEGPGGDENGEFGVDISVDGNGEQQDTETIVSSGESERLSMPRLARIEVPCGQTKTVPVGIRVVERDVFVGDAGVLHDELTLSCPPQQVDGMVHTYAMEVFGRNGRGKVRHEVEVGLRVTMAEHCACTVEPPPPRRHPCEFAFKLRSTTHTDAPFGDRSGEFAYNVTVAGATTGVYDDVRLDETSSNGSIVGRVTVPCGETRDVAFHVAGIELDCDPTLSTSLGDIVFDNADETGAVSDTITLACPPASDPIARTYSMEFRNTHGNVKHEADVTFEQTVANWSLACECVALQQESCDREIAFYSFQHDVSSNDDDPGEFSFSVSLNDQAVNSPPVQTVAEGQTVVVDHEFQEPNLLGTYYTTFVRVPQGQSLPVFIHVEGREDDNVADDEAAGDGGLILSCDQQVVDAQVPLSFEGRRKVRHTGTVTIRSRPH